MASAWTRYLGWAVLLGGIGYVLVLAGRLIPYAGPAIDDMTRAGIARHDGVGAALADLYLHWSGRWAGLGLVLVLGRTFDLTTAYPWLLATVQLTLPVAAYLLLSAVFGGRLSRPARFVLSLGLMAVHWTANSSVCDSYYWLTGAVENHLSLSMCLVVFAGLIGSERAGRACVGTSAVLAAVVPGMHELYGVYLCVALAIGTVIAYHAGSPKRKYWLIVTAAAAGGLAVVVLAPGNATRLAAESPRHDLVRLGELTREWGHLAGRWVNVRLLLATFVLVCHPRAVAACPDWLRCRPGRYAAIAAAVTVALQASAVLVNWCTVPVFLPGRTVSAISFLFLLGWFATAYALRMTIAVSVPSPAWAGLAVACGMALVLARNCRVAENELASGKVAAFAQATRERDRLLRAAVAAGDRNPRIPPISAVPWAYMYIDVTPDPPTPINLVFCTYYGLDSIALRTDATAGGTARR